MQRLLGRIRTMTLYGLSLMLIGGYPLVAPRALAQATEPTSTEPAAPAKPVYTYDEATNHWNSDKWQYNPATGVYDPVAPVVPTPQVSEPAPAAPQQSEASNGPAAQSGDAQSSPTTSSNNNDNKATNNSSASGQATTNTNGTINNGVNSDATTGNAAVGHNTVGGNATTGDAAATATIANVVNSAVTPGAIGGAASFVSNITGDVHGDIVLYPMILAAVLQAASSQSKDTSLTAHNNTDITNDINLNATSGDATVAGNTQAGNATTGSANTVANVLNIINSVIASGTSFIGTVNIFGNLDGDILISPDFLPQLLSKDTATSNTDIASNNNQSITNNLNLNASSGNASTEGNTRAGSATTGDASTNVVLLNMTGHNVVAENSLLVFVNVLGTWVGMIVDAAPGATSAALGDGVSQNLVGDTTVNSTNNATITNNLNLNSQSGNATVTHNTQAGNATSGNATASANILNLAQSSFGLSGWFGVLFINVFGSWNGSVGIDTSSGNPVAPSTEEPASVGHEAAASPVPEVIRFIAKSTPSSFTAPLFGEDATQPVEQVSSIDQPSTEQPIFDTTATIPLEAPAPVASPSPAPMLIVLSVLLLAAGAYRSLFRIV